MNSQNHPKQTLDNLDNIGSELEVELDDDNEENQVVKPYNPTLIRVDPKSFSLRNILDMIDENELDLAPDFQRMRVWSPRQKSRLIESVLLRIPLPAFYFSSDPEGYMQVVDGVQRLSTIHEFARRNGFSLQHLEYLDHELGGKTFSDIRDSIWAKRINNTQITVNVIDPQTPTQVKFDIFKRINTGGTPLNAQEIRHCMSGNRSRELLKRLTALKSFDKATGGRLSGHVRMADRELALRWVSFALLKDLKVYGTGDITNLEDLLNATAENVDSDLSIDIDSLIRDFDYSMTLAYQIFGKHSFRKWMINSNKTYPLNKALFEAWGVSLAKVDTRLIIHKKKEIQEAFRELCEENHQFINSISAGTSDPAKVRYRFSQINLILQHHLQ